MSRPSPQVEVQLQAFASAADRANRPTAFIAIPVLALLASLVFGAIALRTYRESRAEHESAGDTGSRIVQYINDIEQAESAGIDIERLFPPMQFFESQIIDSHKGDDTLNPKVEPVAFNEPPAVGSRVASAVGGAPGIVRSDVSCSINNEDLSKILTWIDHVLNHPKLKNRVFLSSFNIQPKAPGWGGSVTFSLYEQKPLPGTRS